MSLFNLTELTVIVTGGGKGIGATYCQHLAAAGARVVVADIDLDGAQTVAHSIVAAGGQAVAAKVDVTDPVSVDAMVADVSRVFGSINGLVNNAALLTTLPRRSWIDIPIEEWDQVMAVNLKGMFLCCRATFPAMRIAGGGKVVNISSNRVWRGTPNRLHYTASKAGVIGFTRALAREVGAQNIRVNAITPGLTLSETQIESSTSEYLTAAVVGRAITRPQTPDDLVGTVMFLLSDASDFLTGQTINVDGGEVMH